MSLALAGIVTPGNHLIGDGGKAIATFARRAGIAFHTVPSPGKPSPASPPPAHQQRQRLSRPSQAMAQPLQRRRHQEPAQLSRLAACSSKPGRARQTRPAKLDQRRYRKRAIPTDNAIRARLSSGPFPFSHLNPKAARSGEWSLRRSRTKCSRCIRPIVSTISINFAPFDRLQDRARGVDAGRPPSPRPALVGERGEIAEEGEAAGCMRGFVRYS